jgi:hypothetical protein
MRRLLSLVLLLVFGLPAVAPALDFSATPDSRLPACCRRNGAHQCAMSQQELDGLQNGAQVNMVGSKCPCYPTSAAPLQHQQLGFHPAAPILTALISEPTQVSQIQAWARAAEEGARHKRGPPQQLL